MSTARRLLYHTDRYAFQSLNWAGSTSASDDQDGKKLVIIQWLMYSMVQHMLAGTPCRRPCHESEEENLSQLWLPALRVIQIILSLAVIIFILLQARGAGLGSAFGGSSAGSVFKTRRGVERLIFNITIVFVILFALVSLISLLIPT